MGFTSYFQDASNFNAILKAENQMLDFVVTKYKFSDADEDAGDRPSDQADTADGDYKEDSPDTITTSDTEESEELPFPPAVVSTIEYHSSYFI